MKTSTCYSFIRRIFNIVYFHHMESAAYICDSEINMIRENVHSERVFVNYSNWCIVILSAFSCFQSRWFPRWLSLGTRCADVGTAYVN